MVRGLYTAYSGMKNEQKRLDIISNNLANAATVGYKQENVSNQAFDELLTIKIRDGSEAYANKTVGSMSLGVKVGEVYTDYGQGSLRNTGNTFDLAIEGDGFFQVSVADENGDESILYTRDGTFKVSQDGYVVDSEGNHLMTAGGYLQVPVDSGKIVIDSDGTVYADEEYIDKIQLADFEDYDYLEKYGTNLYRAVDGATPKENTGSILQGYTEQSNVNVVSEMVEMINITRAYEANYKVVQSVDSTLQKVVNEMGKVN
ncbi:flagellar basal-body rod protein FlgF [Anaeromicropila populeti]|uniref:Flagellar basal-body rod protein FlgG n=1 Tax=Anaeromicropila populeti TaxID=37658 RepID=A0A1I6J2Y8_9FIRM|nr:flagellar basal-body rod protein FlgF [Anaeromicropila populeti]SFR73231.1 flagellar basal-body rod protein FlgG [Anaeromicropila populeti]